MTAVTPASDVATPEIVVWSKTHCVQCAATRRKLDALSIPYTDLDLENRLDKLEEFRQQGLLQAPVVVVPGMELWSGYRPDLIEQLAAELAADRLLAAGLVTAES